MSAREGVALANRLVAMKDVAATLGISVRSVWRLIAARDLPEPVKVGHCARFYESDVAAYLERLRAQRGGG